MILLLTSLSLIILSGIIFVLFFIIDNNSYLDVDWMQQVAGGCLVLGIIVTLIFGTPALCCKVNETLDYENMQDKRNSLIYQLEHIEEIPDNNILIGNDLFDDVNSFNARLRKIKTRANNPVWSWLYNQKIADNVDYIDIQEVMNDAS